MYSYLKAISETLFLILQKEQSIVEKLFLRNEEKH